jgi:uncharacterized protein
MRSLKIVFIVLIFSSSISHAGLPKPLGWVSDYAGLLDENMVTQISSALASINASTGAEIAVITRNSLEEYGTIEEMALAYLSGWGVGQKAQDNGLVLMLVIDEAAGYRAYRFETGYGLEGELPDGLLGQIGREEIVPRFRQGDYGSGILAAVVRIGNILGADMTVAPPQKTVKRRGGIGSLIFLAVIVILMLSGRGRRSGLLWLLLLGAMGGPRRSGGGFGGGGFGGGFGGFGGGGGGGGGATGSW